MTPYLSPDVAYVAAGAAGAGRGTMTCVSSAHGKPRRFVGRAAELDRLEAALQAVGSELGCAVLVGGEAGIGKTRLASELADRAHRSGAIVLTGHCIDLMGTGLPYLAILEALRPLRGSPVCTDIPELSRLVPELSGPGNRSDDQPPLEPGGPDRQVRLFEEVRALLERLAVTAPLVLVLEDLHWADASTLDLLSYLAYGITDSSILIVATYRDDHARVGDPLPRLVTGLVRAGRAGEMHLGPLAHDELNAVLRDVAEASLPAGLTETIVERSGGNPFFAEELLSAATRREGTLPPLLRDTLLHRVAPLGADGRVVLQAAAAARRDVPYGLLAAVVPLAEHQLQEALRKAVEHRLLVADQTAGTFRFRHALLAEAVYATLLPGEREDLHTRLARALGENRASAGELASHWTAAGRPIEAFTASMRAARDAEAVSGRTEALAHLESVLALWPVVPEAGEGAGMSLSAVVTWAAELAYLTGDGPRAAAHIRRALDLLDEPVGAALLYERLGTYLLPTDDRDDALAAFARAVDLVPTAPPSEQRVRVLAAHGNALMVSSRYAESQVVCEEAIAVAAVGDLSPPVRALDVRALDLCYLGHAEEGLTLLGEACQREHDTGTPPDLVRPYVFLSDALNLVGRLHDAARVARDGLALARRLGTERGIGNVLAVNAAEALLGVGDWAGAHDVLTTVLRRSGFSWRAHPHCWLAHLAIGRGDFDAARDHLDAGAQAAHEPATASYFHCLAAELALWEGRITDAATAVDDGRNVATSPDATRFRTQLCALGIRAEADRAQLAAVRGADAVVDDARRRARRLVDEAQDSAHEAAIVSPDAVAWSAVAEAELSRAEGRAEPALWLAATDAWDRLGRPYPTAYCRWRYVEALLSNGSPTADPLSPIREAYRVALRLGARPLRRELELLAQRARLDLVEPKPARSPDPYDGLGLSPREREVIGLLAYGYTNGQIATQLTISVKTASVHVSHILGKLGLSHRIEAAAIAQKLHPPTPAGQPGPRSDRRFGPP